MKTMQHFQMQKQSAVTRQDVAHVLILIVIALVLCLMPIRSFGQTTPGLISDDTFSAFDTSLPVPAMSSPAPASFAPTASDASFPATTLAGPPAEQFDASVQPSVPAPTTATTSPITANQFSPVQSPPYQQQQMRTPQRETVINTDHPFQQYWGVPNDPQTKIIGKPLTVTELLAGTCSSSARCPLLQVYWELSGLLAIYHFRCETERLAMGAQQENMMTLLREQRSTAELEFIKQQWVLAGLLKQHKGYSLQESTLPIPIDYPLYPRYQTFASKIARTDRTQYLARMIPIQEQLIESKNETWKAASMMGQSASQPFFSLSQQRTMAFLDLTTAIIEYNKMIAEYALETIPANVSPQQFVGAVIRLPKENALPTQPPVPQVATGGITLTHYEMPMEVMAQPAERIGNEFQVSTQENEVSETVPVPSALMQPLPTAEPQ